ncbi:MAG: arsenosugar biosynthesis radical SAM protein ArsS [Deltaproteobacteria bacterium]|nr:arsenosugar biosynthesis radical SAM protein ArsS [Deltaproteobacteria bacterium]
MAARSLPTLLSRGDSLAEASAQRERLRRLPLVREFEDALEAAGMLPLRPTQTEIFQVNVGKVCNQTCHHCHVDAGPDRREVMSRETMEHCLRALAKTDIPTVDVTGGAPELNPHFRWFVGEVKKLGRHVIDRCNLTILETPSHRDLPAFFADHEVEVIASLPHYRALDTDAQRGDGVYRTSIAALERLNAAGYGQGDPKRRLVLVTNPVGALLPGPQCSLEGEWKRELERLHGVTFDALFTITNMPISRYLAWLEESGNLVQYMDLLVHKFSAGAAQGAMCRNTVSVGWDGALYDCDFNQMLELPVSGPVAHISDFDLDALEKRIIETDRHCFGCTAGAGSSCGGATV